MTPGVILTYKISGLIFFPLELRIIHQKGENGENPIRFGQPRESFCSGGQMVCKWSPPPFFQ